VKIRGAEGLVLQEVTPPTPDAGHVALYSPTGTALLMKDDAGVVTTIGGGSTISSLTAASSLADADTLPIVNGGSTKKVDLSALTAYFEQRGRQNNASVANQGAGFATDTYLTGSYVTIPANRLQAKSKYRLRFFMSKTGAGTATPILTVRLGTAGTTADTARATITHTAQTAVADTGVYELEVTFRTVGSGTSAVIAAGGVLDHTLAATGLSVSNTAIATAVSAGFDSTVAGLGIGVSLNAGTSAAWTVQIVNAELFNLA
jgi:hypothetical protein